MNIVAIIPARMSASRFPGKPLVDIAGMPMIGHVYHRVRECKILTETYVATCDNEIAEYIQGVGGKVVMTAKTHERCSDRCAEALLKIEQFTGKKIDILVMVQGDEPLVNPQMIDEAVNPLLNNPEINIVNLAGDISDRDEFEDPNEIKVIVDKHSNALCFSRSPIPFMKKEFDKSVMKKQICIIPFRRDFLIQFNQWTPLSLEKLESIDMLRVLEHGYDVHIVPTKHKMKSVDTPSDLKIVEQIMKERLCDAKYI